MTEEREEYGEYSVDDENQLDPDDTLDSRPETDPGDPLDTGYSPAERYSTDYGNTPWEEEHRETIDQRLRQEVPDVDPYAAEARPDEQEPDDEVGDARAGRLVDPDEGSGEDTENELLGSDVGIDGAGASAEEAAVHVIADDEDGEPDQDR